MEKTKTKLKQNKYKINDNVELYIGDSLDIPKTKKFTMIYVDPPFNSGRNIQVEEI